AYTQRFPDHVALRRILIFRSLRDRRFADALVSLEHLRKVNAEAWTEFVDDNLVALAALGRGDQAKKLAEGVFAHNGAGKASLAGVHAWLSGGAGHERLLPKVSDSAEELLSLRIRFWTAPADSSLAPLAAQPDRAVYELLQHAHFDPRAAVKDARSR